MKSESSFLLNGRIYQANSPVLTIQNRAFKYGDAVFESIRRMDDKLPLFELHWERFQQSLEWLGIHLKQSKSAILDQINHISTVNQLPENGRIRLQAFRDEGGLYAPTSSSASLLIEAMPMQQKSWVNQTMFTFGISTAITKPNHSFFNHKSSSAAIQVLAGIEANARSLQELILVNQFGEVCEGISNNVWLLINGVWKTPSLESGCLNGVFRRKLLLDGIWENYPTTEDSLTTSDILKAERIGFTNAVTGWTEGRLVK